MKKLNKLLMAVTAFTLAFQTAFALPSSSVNGSIDQDNIYVDGEKVEAYAIFKNTYEDTPAAIVEDVQALNAGANLSEVIPAEQIPGVDLGELKLLTNIQDLVVEYTNGEKVHGRVTLTWEVPSLSAVNGDVYVLHYSTVRNIWELLTPDAVSGKTITCTFPDLSPVAVVYLEKDAATDDGNDDVVNTGDSTNMILYASTAVVALAAVALLVKKTKKEI